MLTFKEWDKAREEGTLPHRPEKKAKAKAESETQENKKESGEDSPVKDGSK